MIRYSHVTPRSYVDGPGCRTVVFLQGCPLACPGCQNASLWPMDGGMVASYCNLAELVMSYGNPNITISGGEPTQQLETLSLFIKYLRHLGAQHIIVYTGRTFEWLLENRCSDFLEVFQDIDVLVDGPFIRELDDSFITWRGSRNQRPIDCQATLDAGSLVLLDWSAPEIQIDLSGNLHLPTGLATEFAEAGHVQKSRRCGQLS